MSAVIFRPLRLASSTRLISRPSLDQFASPAAFRCPAVEIEDQAEVALAYEDMWRRLREISGVTSVGVSSSVTMDGNGWNNQLWIEDYPVIPPQNIRIMRLKSITGDYFEAVQNPHRKHGVSRGAKRHSRG